MLLLCFTGRVNIVDLQQVGSVLQYLSGLLHVGVQLRHFIYF